jgi:maleylpyruvate isomerase
VRDTEQDRRQLDVSTAHLLADVASMADADVLADSRLPGWTRGHVLAHIEGNARGLDRLVRWATDGIERPMYISREVRNADVELDAGRTAAHHLQAVSSSAHDIAVHLADLPADRLEVTVVLGTGLSKSAGELALHRLQEVCVHHADLGLASYTYRDWPDLMCEGMLVNVTGDFASRGEFPVNWIETDAGARYPILAADGPGVRGTRQAVLAWILGRRPDPADLEGVGIAAVPDAPTWR